MKNYISKIPLGNNKYAYQQEPDFRELGIRHIDLIKQKWSPPSNFYHVKAGGHVAALKCHLSNNLFSKIDLSRFYYRVTKNKIIRSLKRVGLSYATAAEIAAESVVLTEEGFSIPYGFVQSPILSSIALEQSKLGKFLASIPKSVSTSIYVDDIILSTLEDRSLLELTTNSIFEIAEESGFPINAEKSEFLAGEIVSFNVRMTQNSLVVTDNRMNQFRESLRQRPNQAQKDGVLNYVRQINMGQFTELQAYSENH